MSRMRMGERPDQGPAIQPIRVTLPLTLPNPKLGLAQDVKSTIYLVAEEVDEFPDEAYAKVVFELRRALLSRAALLTHLTPVVSGGGPNHSAPRLAGRGMRRML